MASPVADSYSVASGGAIFGGRLTDLGGVSARLALMASGDWYDYTASTNVNASETSGPAGATIFILEGAANTNPLTNWPGKIAYDPATRKLMGVGTTNGFPSDPTHTKRLFFDFVTDTFSVQWNPITGSDGYGHFYDSNASRVMGGYFYARGYQDQVISRMVVATGVWDQPYTMTGSLVIAGSPVEAFPDLGASGSVLMFEQTGRLHRFNVSNGAYSDAANVGSTGLGGQPFMHYVPGMQSVVFGGGEGGTRVYKIDSSGTVSQITTTLPISIGGLGGGNETVFLPDPSGRNRSWLFAYGGNTVRYVDWDTGTWSSTTSLPAGFDTNDAVGASLHGHGACMFLMHKGRVNNVTQSKVWLYKVT